MVVLIALCLGVKTDVCVVCDLCVCVSVRVFWLGLGN